ncbi:MAG: fibronectin type III domain-containing protein [Saprospiraceae bacterium]|nr:fibronectin type III domain-containing protein [Saprospiraceae bacterium]
MFSFSRRFLVALFFLLFIRQFAAAQDFHRVSAHVQQLHAEGKNFINENLFSVAPPKKGAPASGFEQRVQFLRIENAPLHQLLSQRPELIRLNLPWQGDTLRVELYRSPVLAETFSILTSGQEQVNYTPGACYRGIIENEPSSVAAVSFFDDDVIGVISHPVWGNLNLGKLDQPGNTSDYALYNENDLPVKPPFECTEQEKPDDHAVKNKPLQQVNVNGCVRVFFECDYELFQNKGSVSATVNYVTGFYNVVATLYDNEMISTVISQIFVWTTPDSYSTSSSSDALTDFLTFRTSFDGDLAHLVGLGGGGLGGIAFLDVLCVGGFNYAFSNISASYQALPTYSWTINVVTHEMGHNLSSHHTHWCGWSNGAIDNCGPNAGYPTEGGCNPGPTPPNGGTIMSYCHLTVGMNFSNGFGPQPGDAIRAGVSGAGCLASSCPVAACNAPTALTVTGITGSGAVIGWNAINGATSYNLEYRVAGSASWTTVTGVSNPYTLASLSASTLYEVQVQAVCGGNASPYFTGLIFKTSPSACAEPSDLTATNPTVNSIVLNWTANGPATQWHVQYGLKGFGLGNGTIVTVNAKPYTLTGLNGNTEYDYYVRSVCGGGLGNSDWVGPLSFFTELANDNPSGAIELFVDQPCPGANVYNNTGASVFSGEFSPTTANGGIWDTGISNTVWFKFTAPSSGSVNLTTDISPLGSLSDTQLALYNNSNPTSLNHMLVSNEDGGSIGNGFATLAYYSGLTPGSVYYIQVDGWNTFTGSFCIEVHETFALAEPGASCTTYTQSLVNGAAAPNKWFNIYSKPDAANIGLPVAAIKTGNNLGTVTVKEIRNSTVQAAPNGVKYMQRYYDVTCTQNQSGAKQVRLFFTNTELENLKTAANLPSNTADDLNISHYDGTTEDCTPNNNLPAGTTLITNVSPTEIGSSDIFFLEFQSPGFSEMGAVFGLVALPVKLLYFKGKTENDRNVLEWATSAEKDLAHFTLQRSSDGLSGWSDLGRLEPQPGQEYPKRYEWNDSEAPARAFYRLKVTDTDGSIEYSGIVLLQRAVPDGLLNLYPNPADDVLYAEYQSSGESSPVFRIFGADGRLILEQTVDMAEGLHIMPFEVGRLPAGLYYFAVRGAAGRVFVKR